jgi:ribonuclease HI
LREVFVGHFDGSSVPNPGKMTIGGKIVDEKSNTICTYSRILPGEGTNNIAEYLSLIELIQYAKEKGIKKILIKGDSLLVVNQVNGIWKAKDSKMKILKYAVIDSLKYFDEWKLEHVKRELNKEADKLTRRV